EALARLARDPKTPARSVISDAGGSRLVYVTADVAQAQACVSCHNAHPESPRRDFAVGDVMGALVIEAPLSAEMAAARAEAAVMIGAMLVLMAGVLALLFVILRRFVGRPVDAITPIFEAMATGGGDLTVRLDIAASDEIGKLSAWFNRFMDQLQEMLRQVR